MTVQVQVIADGRDSDWYHPDVTRLVIRELRDSGDFDGIPCPYTPESLISEMIGRLGDVSGKRALVLFTLEMAIALKEAGCEDVTVATRLEDDLTGQLASDIGCRYMLLPGGTGTEGSVMAITPDMKFDIVIGNPPYQAVGRTGNPIWQDFVQSGLNILRGGGRFAMIHPPAWRSVGRTNSRAMAEVRETLKSLDIEWLSMTSMDDCAKFFKGKTIPFDVYIARNSNTPKFQTEVVGTDGVKFHTCIKDMEFIPSFQCDDLDRVLAREDEERVNFIRSRTAYGSEKTWINKERAHDFRHPCVWSVSQNAKSSR